MSAPRLHRRASCHALPEARRMHGYTLLEVVIAFGLLAFAMTLLLGSLSNASRQVRDADRASRAALHAQTLIDQLGVGVPLEPGQRNGELEDGRYRWEMEIRRYNDPLAQARPPGDLIGAPVLMQVRLDMRWGEGRPRERLRVDTLRLTVPSALAPGPQL